MYHWPLPMNHHRPGWFEVLRPQQNRVPRDASTFDALRLIAALGVLFGHYFLINGRTQPTVGGYGDFAPFCVFVFFAISGFFIAGSWERDPSLARYWARRALRIYPALVVTVLATVFVLGPLASSATLSEYFADGRTWSYLRNALLVFGIQYDLPGVFVDNVTSDVNLSLWSLPIELAMYITLSIVGFFAARRTRTLFPVLAAASGALWLLSPSPDGYAITLMYGLGATFFVGASIHAFGVLPLLTGGVVALAAIVLAIGAFLAPELGRPILWMALPGVVIGIGNRPTRFGALIARSGDVSYGVYLWAVPIQQLLVGMMGFAASMVLAMVLTVAAGWVSMRLVEVPALRLRPRAPASPAPNADPVEEAVRRSH